MLRLIVLLILAIAVFALLCFAGNRIARRSRRDRRLAVGMFAVSFVIGLVLALWLPNRVPVTQGSPATLVAIVVLWIVGGSMAVMGLAGLIGAWFSRPAPDSPEAFSEESSSDRAPIRSKNP